MKKIIIKGQITQDGKLVISGKNEMYDFFARNKGRMILMEIRSYGKEGTEAQKGYFYGKVLPDVKEGFKNLGLHVTEKRAFEIIRELYPGQIPEDLSLDREQLTEFMDWVKQWAAENLHTFIADPRTI